MKPLVHRKARRVRSQRLPIQKLHITKGDKVEVISGDDKGKRGVVLAAHPRTGRVTVDGVNLARKHRRATETSEGGIITFPAPLHHSKVMLIDPKTDKPTRIRRQKDQDGTVERISVKSGVAIPRKR